MNDSGRVVASSINQPQLNPLANLALPKIFLKVDLKSQKKERAITLKQRGN